MPDDRLTNFDNGTLDEAVIRNVAEFGFRKRGLLSKFTQTSLMTCVLTAMVVCAVMKNDTASIHDPTRAAFHKFRH